MPAMNPTKMLIAQRLDESEREVRAIVGLMADYTDDPHWARHARELEDAAVLMRYLAESIRGAES